MAWWSRRRSKNNQFITKHPRLWTALKATAAFLVLGAVTATILYFSGGLAAIPFLAPVVAKIGAASIAAVMPVLAVAAAALWYGVVRPLGNLFRRLFSPRKPVLINAVVPKIDSPTISPVPSPTPSPTNSLKFTPLSSVKIDPQPVVKPAPQPTVKPTPQNNTQSITSSLKGQAKVSAPLATPAQLNNALILRGHKVDLSYNYDTLTIYNDKSGDNCALIACFERLRETDFFNFQNGALESAYQNNREPLRKVSRKIDLVSGLYFDRNIHRDSDDHDLYHQDFIYMERHHSHMKFKAALTAKQFETVVTIFAEEGLITEGQKAAYILAFNQRLKNARASLDTVCTADVNAPDRKQRDYLAIRDFIRTVHNNDVLGDLHEHLLDPKFDYLRTITETHPKPGREWQGVDRSGQVVKTSQAWAQLEKGISLQMINNLGRQASKFSRHFGEERAKQLTKAHLFFGIKRSRDAANPNQPRTYKTLDAFKEADASKLNIKYRKIFGV